MLNVKKNRQYNRGRCQDFCLGGGVQNVLHAFSATQAGNNAIWEGEGGSHYHFLIRFVKISRVTPVVALGM